MPDQVLSVGALTGLEFSHYRTDKEIGSGGMGVVFCAYDEHLDRELAIEVLPSGSLTDETERKHFQKEELALCKLNYPGIVTVRDFDTKQGVDFVMRESIRGITLIEKGTAGPLPGLRFCYKLQGGICDDTLWSYATGRSIPDLRLRHDGRSRISCRRARHQ